MRLTYRVQITVQVRVVFSLCQEKVTTSNIQYNSRGKRNLITLHLRVQKKQIRLSCHVTYIARGITYPRVMIIHYCMYYDFYLAAFSKATYPLALAILFFIIRVNVVAIKVGVVEHGLAGQSVGWIHGKRALQKTIGKIAAPE